MSARAVRRARRVYELALLESLIAENSRRMAELAAAEECPFCLAIEGPKQRAVCAS